MYGGDELGRVGHKKQQTDRANLQPHGSTTPHDMGELANSLVVLAVLVEDDNQFDDKLPVITSHGTRAELSVQGIL